MDPRPGQLQPDEVAAVLRRAAELDAEQEAATGAERVGVTESALLDAAAEAGLSAPAVSTALAELRAGALVPPGGAIDAGSGGRLADQRLLDRTATAVARDATRLLERERFVVRRRDADRVVWARGPRSWSEVLRLRRTIGLGCLDEVGVTIAPLPGQDQALVRVDTVVAVDDTDAPAAAALGGGIAMAGGALAWALSGDASWVAAAVPLAGVLGLWRWRDARREALRRRTEADDALSRLLTALDPP